MPASFSGYHAFVDWDDTLKVTNALYNGVSAQNAEVVRKHLPGCMLSAAEISTRVHDIDLSKAHCDGLRPTNYAEAWVEAYHQFSVQHGVTAAPEIEASLYEKAAGVHLLPQPDYPGAHELLLTLRKLQYEITIWTAGDKDTQEGKIGRSGYLDLVDRVIVTQDKNVSTLRKALAERNPAKSCVIGNSPRSDIAPALELGVWAIHVQQDTWAYDAISLNTSDQHYIAVDNLTEVPDILTAIFPRLAS